MVHLPAAQVLQYGTQIASALLAQVVQRADVRMIQAGNNSGFVLETLPPRFMSEIGRNNLMATVRSRRESRAR